MKFIFVLFLTTSLALVKRVRATEKLKILFNDDENGQDCRVWEVLWKPDGNCYTVGERGPCKEDEILSIGSEKSPVCKGKAKAKSKETASNSKIISFDNKLSKTATEEKELDEDSITSCEEDWKVVVNGSCYSLLDQGPCADGDWLVWTGAVGQCLPRQCDHSGGVWWPELCECVAEVGTRYTARDICGVNETLVWSPYGQGVCACRHGYEADGEVGGRCYELGGVGPCDDGQVWGLDNVTRVGQCQPNDNQVRVIIDIIPSTAELRSSQLTRCSADENGKCRKSLKLRQRFGDDEDVGFLEWLSSSQPRGSVDGTCKVATCEGDKIPWVDGQCYQLASTGPCDQNQWLVLDNIVDGLPRATCQDRKCGDSGVWWSQNCSCVIPQFTSRNDFTVLTDCADGEVLFVSPYGDGICSSHWNTGKQQSQYYSVFEIATRRNCQLVDEMGRCIPADESNGNVQGRIEAISDGDTLIQLISWLEQFKRPSENENCTSEDLNDDDDIPAVIDVEEFISVGFKNSTESDCHREGKVLFENGECYNLLERGPCFEESMWLVMTVEGDGDLRAECRPRKCSDRGSVWEPVTCSCYKNQSEPCDLGERLHVDIFGQGVCGCGPDHGLWEEDGGCYKLGEPGPCTNISDVMVLNTVTGATECKPQEDITDDTDEDEEQVEEETESSTFSVLDILSIGGKLVVQSNNNILRATPKTCNLDARGRCRRKVALDRRDDAEEFRLWLQSFQKRSPNNFQCNS